MNIRQRGTAAYVGMVVIVVYHNTMERHASGLQAKELVNETVDDKVHTVHYVGRTVFRAKMRQHVENVHDIFHTSSSSSNSLAHGRRAAGKLFIQVVHCCRWSLFFCELKSTARQLD